MAFNGKGVGPYSAKVYQTTDSSGMSHELFSLMKFWTLRAVLVAV